MEIGLYRYISPPKGGYIYINPMVKLKKHRYNVRVRDGIPWKRPWKAVEFHGNGKLERTFRLIR